LKDKKLNYVYNFLGIKPEQKFTSGEIKPGKHVLGVEFIRESAGKYHEPVGTAKLYVDDKVVAQGPMRVQVGSSRCRATGSASGETPPTT
jgi:arylsulfatase